MQQHDRFLEPAPCPIAFQEAPETGVVHLMSRCLVKWKATIMRGSPGATMMIFKSSGGDK
ncbi:hypothetical protein B9G99_12505 [Kushneria konosiri]|uniref:Uncharacterized protein n=1 Tax=Kushneria konosiri TaxID=698828 RepID=A0A2Z2H896_9GAMM|nr:hypothetical protein B9G99_12505 [Kushneria konosiri]